MGVKRFWINTSQYVDHEGPYVNYEDYAALLSVAEDLMRAGNYIHGTDTSGCHQDCPWVPAYQSAKKFLEST